MQGQVWESAVLAALMNTTPYPIKQPFGSEAMQYVRLYYYGQVRNQAANASLHGLEAAAAGDGAEWGAPEAPEGNSIIDYTSDGIKAIQQEQKMDRSITLLANLAAFEAWQLHWCDLQRLKQMLHSSSSSDNSATAEMAADQGSVVSSDDDSSAVVSILSAAVGADEAEWCAAHHLVPSSLRQVQDTLNILVAAVHKFRPAFINNISGPPDYFMTGVSVQRGHNVQLLCMVAQLYLHGLFSEPKHKFRQPKAQAVSQC